MTARGVTSSLLLGAFTVGVLDALDAVVFFGLRDVAPIRIFQSIASGLLGRAAFTGGLGVAVLGAALHLLNATLIVSVCYLIGTRWRRLLSTPLLAGPVYGLIAYTVMNYVVIPLSAARPAPFAWPVFLNGIGIHMLGVGIPSVIAARAALGMTSRASASP
jgi:hypothetical protein